MTLTTAGRVVRVRKILVRSRPWLRRAVVGSALAAVVALQIQAGADLWVRDQAAGHTYTEASVPAAPVALVLGAQVYDEQTPSPFLVARLEIARRLLTDGKVRAILVSGDNRRYQYNEPGTMFRWLVAHGVPAQRVALDFAGFDTYDSCSRARRVFGVRQAIVVTQTYHLDRAVTLCRELGVDATGVGDDSVRIYRAPWRNSVVRERGAVVKAAFDVLSHRDPVFLGPHETTVDDAVHLG
jgi:vancomycin permeability regulator SanA